MQSVPSGGAPEKAKAHTVVFLYWYSVAFYTVFIVRNNEDQSKFRIRAEAVAAAVFTAP